MAGPSGRPEATAAVLQIRGNVTPGRQTDHADRLAEWLAAAKPQGVLLLASVPTKFQSAPPDLATRAVSYVCRGPGASERASLCQSLGFTLLDDMSASDREEHDRRTQPWPLLR